MNEIFLLNLNGKSILEQLQIEEALLRSDERNFCLLNQGVKPAIVLGISGKAEELLHLPLLKEANLPVIRRFSGGGTVVVDENTLFVSFILQAEKSKIITPDSIHHWTSGFYKQIFNPLDFSLRENDYVLGQHKMGGNAQYIRKSRWLHHTSFLWSYDENKMNLLKMPRKIPAYRNSRSHEEFLCKLEHHLSSKQSFFEAIQEELSSRFQVKSISYDDIEEVLQLPYRKSVNVIDLFNELDSKK